MEDRKDGATLDSFTLDSFTLDKGLLLAGAVLLIACAFVAIQQLTVDTTIVQAINTLSRKSYLLDHAFNDLVRPSCSGAILVALIWYVWFKAKSVEDRAGIAIGFIAANLSGSISRSMQVMIASHVRPFLNPSVHFVLTYAMDDPHSKFSSFPSDHASVFFGLAAVTLLANRRAGYVALAVASISCFARIYLGLHFPSDILGGAGLGILLVCGAYGLRKSATIQRLIQETQNKPLFYAIAFFVSYEVATLFSDLRAITNGAAHALSRFH
jgi:undecaprenyl-diphosphatase